MSNHYYSHEEREAYKEGYRDSERGRQDYYHDRYAVDGINRAYWDGRKDQERDEHEKQEEERELARHMEDEMKRKEEQRLLDEEYEQYLQMQIEEQMEAERAFYEAHINDLTPPEFNLGEEIEPLGTPITEEELFMDIQEDERNESVNNNTNENEQK